MYWNIKVVWITFWWKNEFVDNDSGSKHPAIPNNSPIANIAMTTRAIILITKLCETDFVISIVFGDESMTGVGGIVMVSIPETGEKCQF